MKYHLEFKMLDLSECLNPELELDDDDKIIYTELRQNFLCLYILRI